MAARGRRCVGEHLMFVPVLLTLHWLVLSDGIRAKAHPNIKPVSARKGTREARVHVVMQ